MIVVHVAKNPLTGVWSFIKNIIHEQSGRDNVRVALCLYPRKDWPKEYMYEFDSLQIEDKFVKWIGSYPLSYVKLIFSNGISFFINFIAKKYRDNNVYVHFHNSAFSGIFVPIKCQDDINLFLCATYHGMPGIDPKFKYRRKWQNYLHNRLIRNNVQLVSTDYVGVENASHVLGYRKNEFKIIHNGVVIRNNKEITRKDVFNKIIKVGFCGTIDWNKGWEMVVEAINILHRKYNKYELIIAGSGPEVERLEQCISSKSYISYLGFQKNIFELYKRIDILVIASKVEGLPMVLLEAMMYGIPIVSTAAGDIPYVVGNESGVIVERSVNGLIEGILKISKNYDIFEKFSKSARNKVLQSYDIKSVCDNYLGLYFK